MAGVLAGNVFAPGQYIRDELDARRWTREDFAAIMGRSLAVMNQIINGKKGITPQTAVQLAAAFGTSAELWLNLESVYQLELWKTDAPDAPDVARRALMYTTIPVSDVVRRGWIPKCDAAEALEREVLRFLDIRSFEEAPMLAAAVRKSAGDEETTAGQIAWRCRVRQLAASMPVDRFSKSRMKENLGDLHLLTSREREVCKVSAVLAKMGIRFVVVQHLPETTIDGCTLWLDDHSPVIAVSLRYDRIDGFWFTLAHELFHVWHSDRPPVDSDLAGSTRSEKGNYTERRASEEASNWLIPFDTLNAFIASAKPYFSKPQILQFANLHRIHPGIVVGQLQLRGEIDGGQHREMLVAMRDIVTETALCDGWGRLPRTNPPAP